MKRFPLCIMVFGLAACGAGAPEAEEQASAEMAPAESAADAVGQALDELRATTAKYADVNVALADGYIPDPSGHCVDAAMAGAPAELGSMGIHYLHPQLTGLVPPAGPDQKVDGTDGAVDLARPEVLVYEPQADGSLALVAAEYLVFEKPWHEAGNTEGPTFHGTPFVHMVDDPNTPADEAHGFTPHYELHVWVHRDNPNGVFAEWNPNVTCAHAAMGAEPAQGT